MFARIHSNNFQNKLPEFQYSGCWLAGGAIRDCLLGKDWDDIDVFGTAENLDLFEDKNLGKAKLIYDSPILKTFILDGNKIQLVNRGYTSEVECIDSFDFTITQFAYCGGPDILCNANSLVHLFRKKLVIHKLNPEFTLDSLRRMQKYIQKGFSICDGGLKEFIEAIRKLTPEQIEKQVTFYPNGGARIGRFD
jgi:hypothetical protein